jgi:hypothetical protein
LILNLGAGVGADDHGIVDRARAERFLPEMKWLPPTTGGPKTAVWLSALDFAAT